jgi:hypothetical protein
LGGSAPTRYHRIAWDAAKIEALFVDLFLEAHQDPPEQIVLDLDATDDPLHGHQEGRFFHGYYDCYCYLPLYIFCGPHLLAAKQRPANIDAAAGAVEETARIVARIRARWPAVRILLRGDSGFAREALMTWCELNDVDFLFGLAKNPRLVGEIAAELAAAEEESKATGRPARRFKEFQWATRDSWSCQRRVVAKAEWTKGAANPRFVVTSLGPEDAAPQPLYEEIYCARGDMENRIKECQLDLFADRTSAATMRANQLRLWFASMAYVLLCALRAAPHRPRAHPVRQSHLRHDPPQALKDRRAGAQQCAAHHLRDGLGLPLSARLRACPRATYQRHGTLTKQKEPPAISDPTNRSAAIASVRTRGSCDPPSLQCRRVAAAVAPQIPTSVRNTG